ncbi:MAG TPA: hypothetical protein PLD91_11955 [Spirochaetota bacterium]|nr:hypothetical protein [Spirochaetota bacterium]
MNDLKILKGRNGRIFRAVMNAIIPRGGVFREGAADFDLLPRADQLLMSYDPSIRGLFPLMLNYIQFSSILRNGRVFTSLSVDSGTRVLEAMEQSHFFYRRMIMLLMKLLTMLTFYESDENARLTGYEHGCHGKQKGE